MRRSRAGGTRWVVWRSDARARVTRFLSVSLIALTVGSGLSVLSSASVQPLEAGAVQPTLSFSAPQSVSGITDIVGIACPSASICQAVASTPATVAVTNGTPAAPQPVTGPNSMTGVACSSITTCDGVSLFNPGNLAGDQGVVIPISSGTPGTQIPLAPSSNLQAVACPTASGASCVAVGNTYVSGGSYSAGAWTLASDGTPGSAQSIGNLDFLYSIACPPDSDACMAVGAGYTVGGQYSATTVVVPITGGVPGTPQPIPDLSGEPAIACPNATTCYVAGYEIGSGSSTGAIATITNGIPGTPQTVTGTGTFTGIACPTPDICMAVGAVSGGSAAATVVDGVIGTPQTDTGPTLQNIACPTATQCEAGGSVLNGSAHEGAVVQINIVASQLTVSSLTLNPTHPTTADSSVTASLTVRNDFSAAVTDVVPTLSSSDPTVLAISGGPTPASVASLGAGASTTFTYQLTPLKATTVSLQPGASAVDPTSSPTTAPTVPPLQVDLAGGDLTVALAANPSSIANGGSTTVTATLTNKTGDTLTALTPSLTANPSTGLTIGSPTPATVATLAPYAATAVTWPVSASQPGSYSLTAQVQVTDPTTGTETDSGTASLPVSDPTIVVTTTGDEDDPSPALTAGICDVDPDTAGNQCTLRAAIELANSLGGNQSITFDIAAAGVPQIVPASALPTLQASTSIDGTTQTGGWVSLAGSGAGAATNGLVLNATDSSVRGLALVGWSGAAVVIKQAGASIVGDRVGTSDGASAQANAVGILVDGPNATIGGTTGTSASACSGDCDQIGGNATGAAVVEVNGQNQDDVGVLVCAAGTGSTVLGDWIGVASDGSTALSNDYGVLVDSGNARCTSTPVLASPAVTVGGSTTRPGTAPGNLISGNFINVGVYTGGTSSTIAGNLIGTDATGAQAVTTIYTHTYGVATTPGYDSRDGVLAPVSTALRAPPDAFYTQQADPTIGGAQAGERNVISGQSPDPTLARFTQFENQASVGLPGAGIFGVATVEGDDIGTDISGTRAIPNDVGFEGDYEATPRSVLAGNLVSGNGLGISGWLAQVSGNQVGTNAAGTAALGNLIGIVATTSPVGGARPVGSSSCEAPCNLISGNVGPGVYAGQLMGNYIGTDVSGTAAIPNDSRTSALVDAYPNDAAIAQSAGGTSSATSGRCDQSCNLISGNSGYALVGLHLTTDSVASAQGNMIGLASNDSALPNGAGVLFVDNVGGDQSGQGNVIADNGHVAVTFSTGSGPGTAAGNVIAGNGSGINYAPPGLLNGALDYTPNAPGTNGEPVVPVLASTTALTGSTPGLTTTGTVPGFASSTATSYRIDLYAAVNCDSSPQGVVPLGHDTYGFLSANGFTISTPPLPAGFNAVTATVTVAGSALGNPMTSPFSSCLTVASGALSSSTAAPGQALTVLADGFQPGETVQATLHSTPIALGSSTADANGGDSFTFTVPSGIAPGAHEVVLTGATSNATVDIPLTVTSVTKGYDLVAADGGIFSFGDAGFYGSEGGKHLNSPIVGMASTPTGNGYDLVAADGGIFSFGDAGFYGSEGGKHLNSPIVGMAATPSGNGYWLVAADGGIFSFGDAQFQGSQGGKHLNSPIVGMATTPSGNGYWLVAADGGIFSFGDAQFLGSQGGKHLNSPIVGMASTPSGNGYWLVAADGGIFSFGDAQFQGSQGGKHLNSPIVGMAATSDGGGYELVAADGGIFSFGDAAFYGSEGGKHLNSPIVGMATAG